MDHDSDAAEALRAARVGLDLMPVPRLGHLADVIDDDFDVDLYYEMDELSGLVDAYQSRRAMNQDVIVLDPTIDDRIANAVQSMPQEPVVHAFEQYRKAMRNVAALLSAVAGIPVVARTRDLSDGH
jgi:hypothetical protein